MKELGDSARVRLKFLRLEGDKGKVSCAIVDSAIKLDELLGKLSEEEKVRCRGAGPAAFDELTMAWNELVSLVFKTTWAAWAARMRAHVQGDGEVIAIAVFYNDFNNMLQQSTPAVLLGDAWDL